MVERRGYFGSGLVDRFQQTAAQIEEKRRELEAAGREEWNRATREGRNVVARTTQELRALGAEVVPRMGAFLNGATDAATAGLGDKYVALKYATMGVGDGRTFPERYKSIRRAQEAQDQYDREHYPNSRLAGGAVGAVGSIAATGGMGAAEQGFVRLAPYTARAVGTGLRPLAAHVLPHLAVASAGAGASVAGQLASDAAGGRLSDLGTYGDAVLGGAAGALTTAYAGPRAGAVAEAAVTEGSRGLRTEDFSPERLEDSAVLGAHLASLGDIAGRSWSDSLDYRKKGKLGERMSDIKTTLSGQKVVKRQKRVNLSKGHTFIDSKTNADITVESKFGRAPELSENQKRARNEIPNYQIDSWDPRDIGKAAGGLSGLRFGQTPGDQQP
jgi:hypothetical protein